ncbi:glycosyl transferase [Achromobacter ruhlandii]|nr:glycosyl transferase [Achromobacter ruhlandii]
MPGGLLIMSSPNKKIYSDLAGGDHNHFHIKELYFSELDDLIRRHFSNVRYYGQRVTATSLMQPLEESVADSVLPYTESSEGIRRQPPSAIEPMYYLAIASNTSLPETESTSAFFSERDNAFYDKQREVLELSTEIRRMSEYIAEISSVLRNRDEDLAFVNQQLVANQQALAGAEACRQALAESQATLCARTMRKLRSLFGKS